MTFDIYNLTEETIAASTSRVEAAVSVSLLPKKPAKAPAEAKKRLYLHRTAPATAPSGADANAKPQQTFEVQLPGVWGKRTGSWKEVVPEEGCPWRIFVHWPARALLVFPLRNLSSFLADMPDSLPLSSLLLPGTHDTMAFYGWPVSQCQEERTPLSTQLLAGIRVIDVRLAAVPVTAKYLTPNTAETHPAVATTAPTPELKLIAYHGIYPQRTPFTTILSTIHTFLNSPTGASETIVMSLKQEDYTVTSKDVWSRLVREEIMQSPGGFKNTDSEGNRDMGMWYVENRIPTLGEVRGKVVLFSRFNGDKHGWEGGLQGMGIHPTKWPDSDRSGFVWKLKATSVRTHDWYAIPSFLSIPEKVSLSTTVLHPTVPVPLTFPVPQPDPRNEVDDPQLNITYLSAAAFPLALPPAVAKGVGWPGWKLGFEGVNARTARWLMEELVPDLKTALQATSRATAAVSTENTTAKPEAADLDTTRRKRLRWFRWKKENDEARVELDDKITVKAKTNSDDGGGDQPEVVPVTTMESSRLRGWVMLDYYSSDRGLVPLLVECNYRARRGGQEGWP